MSSKGRFIGFYDMLGLKSIAAYDMEKYKNSLENFQIKSIAAINNIRRNHKNCDIRIFMFSDCAYVESLELEALIDFFQILRFSLFTNQIYFQAAITKGALNQSSNYELDYIKSTIFKGTDTVRVYQMQDSFKGIGVFVDRLIVKNMNLTIKRKIISSAFQYDENKNEYTQYYDIRYVHPSVEEVDILQILKYLVNTYIRMKVLNSRASRYYISAINTIIADLQKNEIAKVKNIDDIIISSATKFMFDVNNECCVNKDLNIFRIVYINTIYNQFKFEEDNSINIQVCNAIFDKLQLKKFDIISNFIDLNEIPDFILNAKNKEYLATYLIGIK